MKKQLAILTGHYGAGKSYAGKYLSDITHSEYIDYDNLRWVKSKDYNEFLYQLFDIVNHNGKDSFVLDGWGDSLDLLPNPSDLDITLYLCFAAPHITRNRQFKKSKLTKRNIDLPKSHFQIYQRIYDVAIELEKLPYDIAYIDTTDKIEILDNYDEFLRRYNLRNFETRLSEMPHDKYYQDINIDTITIPGYSKSHATMDRLKSIVDFKDKSILDIGCFHGYFLFQAENLGAGELLGIDENEYAVSVACQIANLTNSKAMFELTSIENWQPDDVYDICLCLNMLHHVKDKDNALRKIFLSAKVIVFEINNDQQQLLDGYAVMTGVLKCNTLNSHRPGRRIIKYQNPELYDYTGEIFTYFPTPVQYRYNDRKEKIKGLAYHVASNIKQAIVNTI